MNAIGRKWMARELYETCPICDGDGAVSPSKVRGMEARPDERGMAACPECEGEGFIKSGYTVGEVERTTARLARATAVLRDALRFLDRQGYDATYCDDHGETIRRTIEAAIRVAEG